MLSIYLQVWLVFRTSVVVSGLPVRHSWEESLRVTYCIPFYVLDARAPFRSHVLDTFTSAYERGLTPNPCVVCNRYVKSGFLLQQALESGRDKVATGHYDRRDRGRLCPPRLAGSGAAFRFSGRRGIFT